MTSCLVVPAEYVRAEIAQQCPKVVMKFASQKIDSLFDHQNHGPNLHSINIYSRIENFIGHKCAEMRPNVGPRQASKILSI